MRVAVVLCLCFLSVACKGEGNQPTTAAGGRTQRTASASPDIDLFAISDRAFERLGAVGFDGLTPPEQVFVAIWLLEAEVNNGGFDQYYFNSSGDLAQQTPDALVAIGAMRTADLVGQANRVFGTDGPPTDRNKRQDALEALSDIASGELDRFDNLFYRYEDDLEALLKTYVADNREQFK